MENITSCQPKSVFAAIGVLCANLIGVGTSYASMVPWTGSADYLAAPYAAGDEDLVGPFSSYDFASGGVVLIKPDTISTPGSFSVGDTYMGYYQSYVNSHLLGTSGVASPHLNTTGAGTGYELTIAADFSQTVVAVDAFGNPTFAVSGGGASIYFDTTPDYDFSGDSGFINGAPILTGAITGGGGTYLGNAGLGVNGIDLSVSALGFDPAVYSPATITGGTGVFTLHLSPTDVANVNSVMGNIATGNDLLLVADGSLDLMAVPVPASLLLLGSALAGLGFVHRRKVTSAS
jgi:hypothetical protein